MVGAAKIFRLHSKTAPVSLRVPFWLWAAKDQGYDLDLEIIAITSVSPSRHWQVNFRSFRVRSVYVSTFVEVDTMVLKILTAGKMTSPPAYE
ncbi:MAG: hypothetical protein A2535_02945 [Burkholderiales bacterium RIFOXYD2_FULL_59_8]|nr:MAG: hypothetical protein A2503_18170 [Burkholderiales bacterium RIFOXYD12_FULL_59_19]OGB81466.1 MAG: hypothetical protein A2535_02945 [Burkholderiales bacterium RIFOXYD2_FULL_59_8]